jgi:hypothetical protein
MPPFERFFRLFFADMQNKMGYFAVKISGGGDQVLFVFAHELFINTRMNSI